jgi:hypothetical protein
VNAASGAIQALEVTQLQAEHGVFVLEVANHVVSHSEKVKIKTPDGEAATPY